MPTDIVTIAQGVATCLSENKPIISFVPEFELGELSSKKCVIVPLSCDPKPICRNSKIYENISRIEIGFLWRAKNLDTAKLVSEVRSAVEVLQHFKVGSAVCVKVDHDPLYDPEQLRSRNQFTSIVALTFKEICHV